MGENSNKDYCELKEVEIFIKENLVTISILEKIGAMLTIVGYAIVLEGNIISAFENCHEDTSKKSVEEIIYTGQVYTVIAVFLLFISAIKRVEVAKIENQIKEEKFNLKPLVIRALAQGIHLYVTGIRALAFYQLLNNNKKNGKIIYKINKEEEIALANLAQLGSAFIIFGNTLNIKAAELEIIEQRIEPIKILSTKEYFYGAKFIEIGFIIFFYVASGRANLRRYLKKYVDDSIDLKPYEAIEEAYCLSTFAGILRLLGLYETILEEDVATGKNQ